LELYDFVYTELCDWYLELVKPRLYAQDRGRENLSALLINILSETLALAHPLIPFVTEEIWSYLPGERTLLAGSKYPQFQESLVDEKAEQDISRLINTVQALRAWRDSVNCKAGAIVPGRLIGIELGELKEQVERLAHFNFDLETKTDKAVATVTVDGGKIEVLMSDAIDLEAAERRRDKRRTVLEQEIIRAENKLANKGFVQQAPEQLVEAERKKLEQLRRDLSAL